MVDTPALILSKSAFAARRGVSVSAVAKWIARGRLSGTALLADGRIDVAEAERQLGSTLDLSRSAGALAAHDDGSPAPKMAAADLGPMAAIKLEQAQRGLQRDRESDLERRGLYVRTADIRREHQRELSQLITTIEQRLPELVTLLGGGKPEVVTARRWWRSLRQREAGTVRGRAEALPEFAMDDAPELEAAYAA